VSEEPEE
jgi:hypothetical protein